MIFTCTVTQGFSLNWASTVFTCDNSPSPTFVLIASTSVGDTVNCGSFQANATNVSLVGAGRGNLSSTLTPFAPTPPGTVVTCSDPLVSQLPPQQSRPYPNVTGNYDYKLVCGCILYYYAYFSMCTLSRSSISPQRKIPSVVMVTTNQISLHVLYYVDYAQNYAGIIFSSLGGGGYIGCTGSLAKLTIKRSN